MPPPLSAIPALPPSLAPPPPPAYGRPTYASRRDPQWEYIPQPYVSPKLAPVAFQRNGMLLLAQILAIVQGLLALVAGVDVIRLDIGLGGLFTGFTAFGGVDGQIIASGVVVLIIGTLVVTAAILSGRGSQLARWLLAGWQFIAGLTILAALTGYGLSLGLVPLLVVGGASGVVFAPLYGVLLVQAFIIYGLVIHPATNQAFAG